MSRVIRRGCRRFALRAIPSNVINILAVPEPRSAYFLLLVQEKVRKEKDTPVAAPPQLLLFPSPACGGGLGRGRFPALLTAPGRSPNSPARKRQQRALGLDTVERNPPGAVAVLGWLYGD